MDSAGTEALKELDDLLSEIAGWDLLTASWVNVATSLLAFATAHRPRPTSWALETGHPFDEAAEIVQTVSAAVESAVGDLLTNDAGVGFATSSVRSVLRAAVLDSVEALKDRLPLDLAVVVAVHSSAEALDGLFSESFRDSWKAAGELVVRPGTVFPRPERNLRDWVDGRSLNSRPSTLQTRSHNRTSSLAIAGPDFAEYEVVLDFGHWSALAPVLSGTLRAATIHPTISLAEFDIRNIDDPRPLFTNHGPLAAADIRRLARDLIKEAASRGANLAVLHEYALTQDEYLEMLPELDHQLSNPLIVVAGMSALDADGGVSNEADLCIFTPAGMLRIREPHRKLFAAPVGDRDESLTAGTQVRVLVTSSCSIAVLICRDVMVDGITRLISDLGVHLYLVPVMTARTATMASVFAGLAGAAQTFAVLGNGPLIWDYDGVDDVSRTSPTRSEAVFVAPLASFDGLVHCPPPTGAGLVAAGDTPSEGAPAGLATEPGLWLHDFGTGSSEWVPSKPAKTIDK